MNSFHQDTGSWPDQKTWKEQLRPYSRNFGGATAPYDTIFTDPWGSEIRYMVSELAEQQERFVYSFGPNLKDDIGKSDDLVVEVKLFTHDEKQQ